MLTTSPREQLISRTPGFILTMVPALISEECDRGILRTDLDPRLATLSLLSMAVFPFISRPVVEPVFGVDMDEGFVQRWIDHALRLFYEGAEVKK